MTKFEHETTCIKKQLLRKKQERAVSEESSAQLTHSFFKTEEISYSRRVYLYTTTLGFSGM